MDTWLWDNGLKYTIYVQDRLNKGDYNLTKIAWSMGQLVRRGLNNMIDD